MKWISVKDKLPFDYEIIVAIMEGRQEWGDDPIEDARIVILRNWHNCLEFRTLDTTEIYYLPGDNMNSTYWDKTIKYWIPWQEFGFPASMILDNQICDAYASSNP